VLGIAIEFFCSKAAEGITEMSLGRSGQKLAIFLEFSLSYNEALPYYKVSYFFLYLIKEKF
jgi:hypothetical protein